MRINRTGLLYRCFRGLAAVVYLALFGIAFQTGSLVFAALAAALVLADCASWFLLNQRL